ncbi:unnamed protein product [Mycena citricolor]|uniref:C2H2-type domain-containing protein n=1 Tax=Mycena citricolor TaxID=2018698 RepID=A0AAD2JVV1_9AGAR|nr:unnamed protein product [Mycena citricolor]
MPNRPFHARNLPCPVPGCDKLFKNQSGLTQHRNRKHAQFHIERAQARSHLRSSSQSSGASAASGGVDFVPQDDPGAPPLIHPPAPNRRDRIVIHPFLDGTPCDAQGNYLPPGSLPPPREYGSKTDYSPYANHLDFHLADLLYRRVQMSGGEIDELMQNWAARNPAQSPPFNDHDDLYGTIDATELDTIPWQSFEVRYNGTITEGSTTPWKQKAHTVYFRNPRAVLQSQLGNPDFAKEMDFAAKLVYAKDGSREYQDFMSGNWAWRQSDMIANDQRTHGATFVPIILGSDKTTVSVATGQNDFYPLYLSNGLVYNSVRRAHRNAVTLIGFLAIPKTDRENEDSSEFRTFRRNLFHGSLCQILESLREGMSTPEVVRFADGHYRRVVYGLGPYIADYPEQVLLAGVVQGWCARCTASNKDLDGDEDNAGRRSQKLTEAILDAFTPKEMWSSYGVIHDVKPFTWSFPRADIHELLSPDLLHQLIKGTFKDHLVTWVEEYLEAVHGSAKAKKIMADIDRRIAAVPAFPGLRRFPEGRGFKQWTGDDSKALMKVYMPAIEGHVPSKMICAFSAFLDFCYLVRRNIIDQATLVQIRDSLTRYHQERRVFEDIGVVPNKFCLPRQHSLSHYAHLIQEFGAPNGLCSSITESKHIKAVKEPWRRSSRFQALEQMLTINERLDKLAAARVDFKARGMSVAAIPDPAVVEATDEDENDDLAGIDDREIEGEVKLAIMPVRHLPRNPYNLAPRVNVPTLPALLRRFLYAQNNPDFDGILADVPLDLCPDAPKKVRVFPSATATFYAPSDQSGLSGHLRERIRASPSWRRGAARHDCVFVEGNDALGFRGLMAARVQLFISFKYRRIDYACAVVNWFSTIGDQPCPDMGMWMVEPDLDARRRRVLDVIHIDSILRGAHLVPIFGKKFIPRTLLDLYTRDVMFYDDDNDDTYSPPRGTSKSPYFESQHKHIAFHEERARKKAAKAKVSPSPTPRPSRTLHGAKGGLGIRGMFTEGGALHSQTDSQTHIDVLCATYASNPSPSPASSLLQCAGMRDQAETVLDHPACQERKSSVLPVFPEITEPKLTLQGEEDGLGTQPELRQDTDLGREPETQFDECFDSVTDTNHRLQFRVNDLIERLAMVGDLRDHAEQERDKAMGECNRLKRKWEELEQQKEELMERLEKQRHKWEAERDAVAQERDGFKHQLYEAWHECSMQKRRANIMAESLNDAAQNASDLAKMLSDAANSK